MWKTRFIANGRCYHLISRLVHQAFFLDDDEKTRAVELLRRAEDYEWCSFVAAVRGGATRRRGYALMYGNGDWEAIQACHEQSMCEAMDEVLAEREKEERSVKGRSASSVRNRAPRLKAVPGLETPKRFSVQHTFQSLLPCTVVSEGASGADGSGASPVTETEIQVGVNYYVNTTMSTISDPCSPRAAAQKKTNFPY